MKKNTLLQLLGLILVLGMTACTLPQGTAEAPASQTTVQDSPQPTRTPQPTDTPQPTLTATTTPTLPPAERYFKEIFDTGTGYWYQEQFFGNENGTSINVRNGILTFELESEITWAYLMYEPFTYKDVRLEMSVANLGSEQNSIGVICRYDENQGWYEFNVSNDGIYNILYGQKLADGISQYNPIVAGQAQKLKPGNEPNQYAILCQDNVISVFINGVQMRSIREERYNLTEGQVGITVSSFQDLPVVAEVDWVEISSP